MQAEKNKLYSIALSELRTKVKLCFALFQEQILRLVEITSSSQHRTIIPMNSKYSTIKCKSRGIVLYIKELEEGNMFFFWTKFFFFILKEEEVGEGGINQVRMLPGEGDEVQTLPSRITTTPECLRLFQLPWHLIV